MKSLTSGVIEALLKTLPGKLKGVLEEVGNLIFSKKNRRKDADLDRSDGKTRDLADEQRKPKDKVDENSNEESDSDRKTDTLDNNDQERNDQEDRKSIEEADETSSPDDQSNDTGDSGKSKSTEDSSNGNDRETHTDGDGTDTDVDPDAPNKSYRFEQHGLSYESEIVKNADGSTSISHFATQDGKRKLVGVSEVTADGKLTNAFEVPDQMKDLEISKRMYAEAESVGFKTVEGQYHPSSDNFKEFFKHYDPKKGNDVEALYQTPAGKVAKSKGLKPTSITITDKKVEVIWSKE